MNEPITAIERLVPWIPIIAVIAGGIIAGAFAVWNRRRNAVETRVPDVTAMWAETERARRLRQFYEDLFFLVRGAFRAYARRVQAGGSTDLTASEQEAHDNDPQPPKEIS